MNKRARLGAAGAGLVAACVAAVMVPTLVNGGSRTAADPAVGPPYVTALSGAAEAPGPGDSDGEGAAAVTVNAGTGQICVDLRVDKIQPAVMAHIHRGAVGEAGPVVVPLPALPNPTSSQCVVAAVSLAAEIVANPANFYVNVHTTDFPNGAIRGQLGPVVSTSGTTQLLNEPLRAYDSRLGGDGKLAAGTTRVVSVATGVDGAGQTHVAVPPGATAAILRVTITDAEGAGFLKVYSNALANAPATSGANWYADGAIVGSDPIVAVDATGKIKLTAGINSTHVVVDVVGYLY
jgi:hypothetical protein